MVDDEELIRSFVATVLQGRGYDVRTAADGQEALAFFREYPRYVRLLLTDLGMPRKNGIELIREVRADKPTLPVVVMSGDFRPWHAKLHDLPRIPKPITIPTLLLEIEKALDRSADG